MDPQEIKNVEFKITRIKSGYDPDEVDNFLDKVEGNYKVTLSVLEEEKKKTTALRRELAEANRKLAEFGDAPTMQIPMNAARILEAAQRTADDVVNEAKGLANSEVLNAEETSQRLVAEAQQTADALVGKARARQDRIEEKVQALQAKHEQIRVFLSAHLQSGLEALDNQSNTQ